MKIKAKITKNFDGSGKTKAIADVVIEDAFVVKGFRIIEGDKGIFVSMPGTSYQKGEEKVYQDSFFPISSEARKDLIDEILGEYEQSIAVSQYSEPICAI